MAITGVKQSEWYGGHVHGMSKDITGPASYPTGGFSIAASDIGLKGITSAMLVGTGAAQTTITSALCITSTYPASVKIQCFVGSSEVSNATDLSTITFRFRIQGF